MNIPRRKPPKKRAAAQTRLTPMEEVDVWSWWKAKQYIGTFKTKSREMGIPAPTLLSIVQRMKRREARSA